MALERLCIRARSTASPLRISGRRVCKRSFSSTVSSRASTPVPVSATPITDEENNFSSHQVAGPSAEEIAEFDPLARTRSRTKQLPTSRYKVRPPRYYRGPLHPHQPPRPSDPSSREFVPGPFTLPRMQQKYDTTLTHDLMALYYEHIPPGTPKLPVESPLRYWGDESPYMKNRPPRPPRGQPYGQMGLVRRQIDWWNLPRLERIHVAARVEEGASDSRYTHAYGMALQAITGSRATVRNAKKSTGVHHGRGRSFTQKSGKPISVSVELKGESMWHFLSTLVDVVLPRIKEWGGIPGRSGDDNGNIGFRVSKDVVMNWPEIAVNYDAYPPDMIPTVQVSLVTSCKEDRDMRLFVSSLGFPFKGNHSTK